MPISHSKKGSENVYHDQFPLEFKWGSSSSAYQVEGACHLDGKGQTWWDFYCQANRHAIVDKSIGNMGADSYRRFEKDVMLLKAMKATCYKFSLSWSRILPFGTLGEVNQSGLDYYDDLINTLLENGIEPIVVLYHWDFPQPLFENHPNSWLDEDVLTKFGLYAKLCFKIFGDRVKHWVSIHDPWTHSISGYGNGNHPPGIRGWNDGIPNKVYKNLLKAHSIVFRIYNEEFRLKQKGLVGISANSKFLPSSAPKFTDDHIFYPSPSVSPWKELFKNPTDFIVLDHENSESKTEMVFEPRESNLMDSSCRSIREILNTIKNDYGNPMILLSGHGQPLRGNRKEDLEVLEQIDYFKDITNEVLKSVKIDGCNVIGFLAGTLVDSWEWENGFTISYGLHKVDFDHPEKPRTQRNLAKYFIKLFQANGFTKD